MNTILRVPLARTALKSDGCSGDGPAAKAHGQARAFATPIVSPHHAAAVISKESADHDR